MDVVASSGMEGWIQRKGWGIPRGFCVYGPPTRSGSWVTVGFTNTFTWSQTEQLTGSRARQEPNSGVTDRVNMCQGDGEDAAEARAHHFIFIMDIVFSVLVNPHRLCARGGYFSIKKRHRDHITDISADWQLRDSADNSGGKKEKLSPRLCRD